RGCSMTRASSEISYALWTSVPGRGAGPLRWRLEQISLGSNRGLFARHNTSLKKTLYAAEQKRADVARARRHWMRKQGMFDRAQAGVHQRNLHEHCDDAAARPCFAWRAALRAAWTLENNHLRGLRQRGMTVPFVLEGAINGPMFLAYVEQCVRSE